MAAAADLRVAFGEMVAAFERAEGARVVLVFGSTGLLARQVRQGAPFDLLFAANESYIADLERQGGTLPGTRTLYAVGRLAVYTPNGMRPPRRLADLAGREHRRIAIANPDHAPYGAAAREALQRAGIWHAVEPRVVYGENVQQALQHALTGNATAAVVALSLRAGQAGRWTRVPEGLHQPILQAAAALRQSRDPELARRFLRFVVGPAGRDVLQRCGFGLP